MRLTYFLKTFGCQANLADSERVARMLEERGMVKSESLKQADYVVINTCMVRESAENRVYGLVNNLGRERLKRGLPKKIVLTGCLVGMAVRDKTGKFWEKIRKRLPQVDEFLPIEEVGFDYLPLRSDPVSAWVPISTGCNNFCTFCVVPFTRGREKSRPYEEILKECQQLASQGYQKITLLGMNVNSYGADLLFPSQRKSQGKSKPFLVKNLGRLRVPTLFPKLLADVCQIEGIKEIDFLSSNPWDFSDGLIEVIAQNPKITRKIHLPVQSGSNTVLRRMNRGYSREEYLELVRKLKAKIKNLKLTTDIIVGFCGETEKEFQETVDLAKKVGFSRAYIAMYSDRPMTAAHKIFRDDVPYPEKKRRWQILEDLINRS